MSKISEIHHITATVDDLRHNPDFYTKVLGVDLVKSTIKSQIELEVPKTELPSVTLEV